MDATVPEGEITRLIGAVREGDKSAEDELYRRVIDELRKLAAHPKFQRSAGQTLTPTALANEAYMALNEGQVLDKAANRRYFFKAAAKAMRNVLIDHARARQAAKRGGGRKRMPLDDAFAAVEAEGNIDLLDLDRALKQLEAFCPRHAQTVELKFFGGLTVPEIAEQLEVSISTVESDLRKARAWLFEQLAEDE